MQTSQLFPVKSSLNCRGNLLSLDLPVVMGILNLTPDSFFEQSRVSLQEVVDQAGKMLEDGASILDLGGMSTRPGAKEVEMSEELDRLIPAVEAVHAAFPYANISVDTYRAAVADVGIQAGAAIINDISAGDLDPEMFPLVAKLNVPYIAMHMQGIPVDMQKNPAYRDVANDIYTYLYNKLRTLRELGVSDVVFDPGFGFGKALHHNYQLLNQLEIFRMAGVPVLVGVSRKSMINKVLGTWPDEALNGTTVLNSFALLKGASILRVHDVKEAVQAVKLYQALTES